MNLIQTSESILQQLKALLNILTKEQYSSTLDVFSGASIGQHTRHILEFYQSLTQAKGVVCYDSRKRDLQLEIEPKSAVKAIEDIIEALKSLNPMEEIVHKAAFGKGENIEVNVVKSSLGREIIYAVEHAVHHMAIIKIGLITNWPGIKIDQNFGVADSTVHFKEKCAR